MISCDSVPAPLTILVCWFSPKKAKAVILPISTLGLPDCPDAGRENGYYGSLGLHPTRRRGPRGQGRETDSVRQNPGMGAGKPCSLVHSLGSGFDLSSSTFQDGLRPHWTLLITLGKTCLILQGKPHQPRDSQNEDLRAKKNGICPCSTAWGSAKLAAAVPILYGQRGRVPNFLVS